MYRIDENDYSAKKTLLIPAMLDVHFPLMRFAFFSPKYRPVILENEADITETGLRYVHNDMCYPCILNVGQMLAALQSCTYNLEETLLLMPSAGDSCRGANYTEILRKAVKKAGFSQVKVVTLNVQDIDKENQMQVIPSMVWRALFALMYGDLLLLLTQQIRPYEQEKGATDALYRWWVENLSVHFREGKHLTFSSLKRNFRRIANDFAALPRSTETKKRVGLVGELYIRYCHLGNRNTVQYLEENGCESYTNGLSWYVLYYLESHADTANFITKAGFRIVFNTILSLQKSMLSAIRNAKLFALPDYAQMKKEANTLITEKEGVGDGWLIAMEAAGYMRHGIQKVLGVQPFGCMPSHVFGRGQYASIARKLGGQLVSIDFDPGLPLVNIRNRIRLLIDGE